jgi:hypothetical protein
MIMKTKVSLRAQRGNLRNTGVIARECGIPSLCSEQAWQSIKKKTHLSYEIATLRSQ